MDHDELEQRVIDIEGALGRLDAAMHEVVDRIMFTMSRFTLQIERTHPLAPTVKQRMTKTLLQLYDDLRSQRAGQEANDESPSPTSSGGDGGSRH